MGGYLEVVLGCQAIPYEVEAFNKKEVVLRINRAGLEQRMPRQVNAYITYWYGMVKTLVGTEWALWEEADEAAPDVVRVKIAKKIDKFC